MRGGSIDQILVIEWCADHGRFVSQRGGAIGQIDRLANAFDTGSRDQQFFRRGIFGHPLPQLDLLFGGEINALARRVRETTYPARPVRFHFSILCWTLILYRSP